MMVPSPSLSIDPPSSTNCSWLSIFPLKARCAKRVLLMQLSSCQPNFSPQPLNLKSSSSGPSACGAAPLAGISVSGAWSRAQVSLLLHADTRMFLRFSDGRFSSRIRFTSSGFWAATSSFSCLEISRASCMKVCVISARQGFQSVF